MRVVWSAHALADRMQILDYWFVRTGSKVYSRKLDNSFKAIINHLTYFPEMGRKLDARDERFVVKDAYLIFYRVVNDEIHIIHIWDSRRNPADLYFSSLP